MSISKTRRYCKFYAEFTYIFQPVARFFLPNAMFSTENRILFVKPVFSIFGFRFGQVPALFYEEISAYALLCPFCQSNGGGGRD
jgi:hypothetical protein